MDKQREHLYLAALLHDVGKFYQRADRPFADVHSTLSDYSKRLANDICPVNEAGRFGYQHVIWTNEFLCRYAEVFNAVLGKANLYEGDNEDTLPNLACNHHSPKSKLQAIVSLADRWSAGIDRQTPKDESENPAESIAWGRDRYKKIPLHSVFNDVSIKDANKSANEDCKEGVKKEDPPESKSAFPLKPLAISDECFPKAVNTGADGTGEQQYKTLWEHFVKETAQLPTDSFKGFAESLLYLLKKYTWSIPSNTMDMANVSLFEHLKTTAAFADCLYLYLQAKPDAFLYSKGGRLKLRDGECPTLLLGGDLSGIQKFIYNIASRKAAVSLKGRSFYLQLLIDSVIQRIISHEDIDVTVGNVVYSSGGKFYMLLPNTEQVKTALKELKEEFENELWHDHHGQLILNLDFVPFAYSADSKEIVIEDESGKTIGDMWKRLADKLSTSKNQKFRSVLETHYSEMFEPIPFNVEAQVCAVTGIESAECVKLDSKDEDSPYVLPIVKWQTGLGQTLKDASFIITCTTDDNTYLGNRSRCNNVAFGVSTCLFNGVGSELEIEGSRKRATSSDFSRIKKLNDTEFLTDTFSGHKSGYGFSFYGGNRQALTADGKMKTFEQLANGSYLGILRMDVDNLGSIFIEGLPPEQRSFAAFATLSFLLDYFFSGYLNLIRKKYNSSVNILYSGGDDVFAVGRWDKLIEFASDVRREFERFAGRKDVSISGGVAMVGEKFPLAKAAELAGEAEHAAKQFKDKNAFNLFGQNISWEEEFEYVECWKKKMVEKCGKEKTPRSLLHRLMLLAQLKSDYDEYCKKKEKGLPMTPYDENKKHGISYAWHTAYFLKRFADGKSDAIRAFCKDLQRELLMMNKPRNFHLLAVAARWAELELKEFSNN
jgi:CRISPR-associated protein Csm1